MGKESSPCIWTLPLMRLVTRLESSQPAPQGEPFSIRAASSAAPRYLCVHRGISESSQRRRMASSMERPGPHHWKFVERGPKRLNLEKRKIWALGQVWELTRQLPQEYTATPEVRHSSYRSCSSEFNYS